MTTTEPTGGVAMLSRPTAGAMALPRLRWKTRILLPALILSVAAGLLLYTGREALRPAIDVEVVPVVVKAGHAAVPGAPSPLEDPGEIGGAVVAQAPGWIEPDPFAVNIPALADGIVKEVLILEGQHVEAGQVVARLIDDDARLQLARAEADSREKMAEQIIAEADLKEARMNWDNRTELNRAVGVAEAKLEEARAELARLPLEVDAQSAKLEELRDDLARKEELVAKRAVAEGDVVQLRHRVKAQEAALAAAKSMRTILAAQVKMWEAEALAATETLRLRVQDTRMMAATHARLEASKAGAARAEAMRDEARLRLARMDVRAPVAGVVLSRLVEPGSKVAMGMDDPGSAWIARLYDPRKLQVRVDVPLVSAGTLGIGMPAEISVEALPGRVFKGRVTRLVHEANIQKNTVQVKVAIEDPAPELKPEMLTRVKLFGAGAAGRSGSSALEQAGASSASGTLIAPTSALMAGAEGLVPGATARAWVVDQARREARQRTVRLGTPAGTDGWIEITEGLRPGDRLIAGDVSRLREGVKVRTIREKNGGDHGVH